ncbi:MAG: YceI family protein [Saprospiraceae bacterium]|nr:YceI family protein [Saprospiraceae bacterium]MCB0627618.1 YceI family protein [Saprospiraceae bacterium]MCB0677699.1 YceI family protein [Saprospiraceae bacterium]MCB0683099.1 YceI family protein [Saprospiraceae bacterium]
MKNVFLAVALIAFAATGLQAQKYFTREGSISFFSDAPLEKIEAHNGQATSVIDFESGKMEIAVLIKAFQFEKALMEEHFNENYMESSKYPKALFKGQIADLKGVDLEKEGTYPVKVIGSMTIHGVTNELEVPAELTIDKEGVLTGNTNFELVLADYEIAIPSVVKDNIAKTVKVTANFNFQEFKKGS